MKRGENFLTINSNRVMNTWCQKIVGTVYKTCMSGDSNSIGTVIAAGMTGVDAKLDPQFLTGASLVLCTHVGCSHPPETEA